MWATAVPLTFRLPRHIPGRELGPGPGDLFLGRQQGGDSAVSPLDGQLTRGLDRRYLPKV